MIFCKRCGNYAADGLDTCPKCAANLFDAGEPTLVGATIPPSFAAQSTANAMFGSSTEPAGHLQRFVALLIDGLLFCLVFGIVIAVTLFVGRDGLLPILMVFAASIAAICYEPYFIATEGATPGKKAMGLRVVDQDGGTISVGKSILRYLLKSIFGIISVIVGLFTPRRQCLHDLIVGTYVVRA